MSFVDEKALFDQEMDAYYAELNTDITYLEDELHRESSKHPEWLPYQRKAIGYQWIAEHCPVHVFRHCPFYFEIDTGRPRTDLGTGGLGGWMKREPFGVQLTSSSNERLKPYRESGLSKGFVVLDDNHHAVGYDNVFRYGLRGLIQKAEERLSSAASEKEHGFLLSVISGNQSLINIATCFSHEASNILQDETSPAVIQRLERIAASSIRVPVEPPSTFYEALNTMVFLFYVVQAIEGNGISVFGRPDRLLLPYYRRDIEAGRITREEAADLLGAFLAISDARFGMKKVHGNHVGTNGTVTIGGCDRNGEPVFNELTEMILEAHQELRLVDPKINARISAKHRREFYELLGQFIASGDSALAIFNDDVIIPANIRMGKEPEDCHLYVGGGCQENVLENTEVNSRATIYLNLMHVFLMGFSPQKWNFITEQTGLDLGKYHECAKFHDFLRFCRKIS